MRVSALFICSLALAGIATTAVAAEATSCSGAALPRDQSQNEDTIRRVERAWLEAEMRGDVDSLRCLIADNYVNIGMDGKRHDKDEILRHAATRKGKNLPVPTVEVSVVIHGNAATAYSIQHKHDGSGKPVDVYFADAFAFDGANWHPYFSNDVVLVAGMKITD